ncbi:hypothetical protein STRAU_3346 [Streptomyces aurantiacus JA 4570]|uniref:Uncharacterized protein n=1 Tax=Streptomyces aurantiacus JA 4570 TaxID=1286094 RepID=S4APZ4_9ACTN|nr:hypothetical protein STRAU_3346 [Streptomyces aurantiacus JA 4570]
MALRRAESSRCPDRQQEGSLAVPPCWSGCHRCAVNRGLRYAIRVRLASESAGRTPWGDCDAA